ncbi:uncharacterized protein LOC143282525 [Babylonia areolata]|uniref:uncharacterized protein LOC143282525 n=1 Tax=Babylonia areolata TaxID=304850 RepID=UPI003FD1078B
MQSCWNGLVEIHASLTPAAVHTINPEAWHKIISQTLSASDSSNDASCCVTPEKCLHCHQMVALSAVTTMTLLARNTSDMQADVEKVYLQPLLQNHSLTCMVGLLQQHCQYLRYQSRKALTSICSLPGLMESSVRQVTEQCVQAVLHSSTDDAVCLEPLQLLCCLLSARPGCRHRLHISALLLPHLPALYQHCCLSVWILSSKLDPGALSAAYNTGACGFRDEGAARHSYMGDGSTFVRKRAHGDDSAEDSQKQTRTEFVQEKCESAASFIHKVNAVKESAGNSGCEIIRERDDHSASSSNTLGMDRFRSTAHMSHSSHQPLMLHYVFLCMIQKLAKLFNSLEADERELQTQVLTDAILSRLVTDHTALFSEDHSRQTSDCLLVERKFLDILDTVLDYVQLRTSSGIGRVYKQVAVHFVRCMQAADCCWSFPGQNTFIGGQPSKHNGGKDGHSSDHMNRWRPEGMEELLGERRDTDCSPVLVLLLAVVFKSGAIISKSEREQTGNGEDMGMCARLLRSMHSHLQETYSTGSSAEKQTGNSPTCLTWLAQVCGEQDDRWIEALLCLLDIFICLQPLPTDSDDMAMLRTLLDPHPLFIQLLEVTHYNASLLIDWLTSPETCFLAYITRYLRLVAADFSAFVSAASSLRLSACSGSSELCKKRKQEQKEMVEVPPQCSRVRQVNLAKLGSSGTVWGDVDSRQPPRSPVHAVHSCNRGTCPESPRNRQSESEDGISGTAGLDRARESSLGMALLSCYDGDSSNDGTDDGSSDEGSFDGVAADSLGETVVSFEKQEGDVLYHGKRGARTTEDEVKPSRVMSRKSTDTCSDVDNNDDDGGGIDDENQFKISDIAGNKEQASDARTESRFSHTETERTCKSSQSVQHNLPCPMESHKWQKSRLAETRGITDEDSHDERFGRVMHLLTEVRVKLQKLCRGGLLVYNPTPLLSLIKKCEHQYNSKYV